MSASEQMGPVKVNDVHAVAMRAGYHGIRGAGIVAQLDAAEVFWIDLVHKRELQVMRVIDPRVREHIALPADAGGERGEWSQIEQPGKVRVRDLLTLVVQREI